MTSREKFKRYLILFVGLMCNAFGVAMLTKSGLGASPIAAIPFAMSLAFPTLTMGRWLILFNFLLIAAQVVLLCGGGRRGVAPCAGNGQRGRAGSSDAKTGALINAAQLRNLLLQALLTFIYGNFTDFAVWALGWVDPLIAGAGEVVSQAAVTSQAAVGAYALRLAALLVGCLLFGFGVNFELTSDISMLPGNALPKVIAARTGREYGTIRVISDVLMTAISAAISLVFLGRLASVREGTVIAAVLIGNMVRLVKKALGRFWTGLKRWVEGSGR